MPLESGFLCWIWSSLTMGSQYPYKGGEEVTTMEELEKRIERLEMAFDRHAHRDGLFGIDRTSGPVNKDKEYFSVEDCIFVNGEPTPTKEGEQ